MAKMTFEKRIKVLKLIIALNVLEREIEKDVLMKVSPLMWNLKAKGCSIDEIIRAINYKLDQELEKNQ